jgi:parallel beta-helix repeat protein
MVLPTTASAISAGTPSDHVSWHNEIDTLLPHLQLPTVSTATASGHVAHHEAIHAWVGGSLPEDLTAGDPGHLSHHLPIHQYLTPVSGTLTINSGGTYSGSYSSSVNGTPAVTINTTSPVTLDNMLVRHTGQGVVAGVSGVQLTVTNCVFERRNPSATLTGQQGRAILLTNLASLIVEHSHFANGNGIWIGTSGTVTGRVRYNRCWNVGHYGLSDCCIQFFQADGSSGMTLGGFEIGWNHTTNYHGQSQIEDNVNLYQVSGASGNPIDVHHNLIDGAYATSSNGDGYTGGGILCGDEGGSWVTIRDNWVIGTSNYGVSITGGSNNTLDGNTVVSDSLTQDGTTLHSPTFGTGAVAWDASSAGNMTNITVTDNTSGWLRRTGVGSATERSDMWFPEADVDTGNTSMSGTIDAADEQAARDAWEAARVVAGVTVGRTV